MEEDQNLAVKAGQDLIESELNFKGDAMLVKDTVRTDEFKDGKPVYYSSSTEVVMLSKMNVIHLINAYMLQCRYASLLSYYIAHPKEHPTEMTLPERFQVKEAMPAILMRCLSQKSLLKQEIERRGLSEHLII